MTAISANQNTPLSPAMLTNAGTLMIAAGVLASAAKPLGANLFAQGLFPAAFAVKLGTLLGGQIASQMQPSSTFTAQVTGQNTANVDLGDGYRLEIDERNSQMNIVNENTGQTTQVWGDPHVNVNGEHQFDFYGTTTFELDNGTKITVNTEQSQSNPNVYFASQVVVTKGSSAAVIDGISQQSLGDLSVSVSNNGYALDAANRDGFTVLEGSNGWQTEVGTKVNQAAADLTKPGEIYGPDSNTMSLTEIGNTISGFLLLGGLFGLGLDASVRAQANASASGSDGAKALRQILFA